VAPALLMLLATLPWGQGKVSAVEVVAPGGDAGRLARVFGVQPGYTLDREAIRAGVQALLATREVEDVAVEVSPRGEGYGVLVRTQVASRVGKLEFSGLPGRQRGVVAQELAISPGSPLLLAPFERALARAQELLRADGFPEARLDPQLEFHVAQGTVDVRIAAVLGPPLLVCQLQAQGLDWDAKKLWRACDVKPGRRLTLGTQEGMRRRLLAALRQQGYWQAEVEGPQLLPAPCGSLAQFAVRLGPRFSLKVKGAALPSSLLREAFPFLAGEEGFAAGSETWLAERLRRALQRQGYLLAQVEVTASTQEASPVLEVKVDRGPKLLIKAVRFPGVPAGCELAAELPQRVAVRAGRLSKLTGLVVDDETLAADRESVLELSKRFGFAEAQVAPVRLVREGDAVAVEFPVTLGQKWQVEEVAVEGWPPDLPQPALPLLPGGPWSEGLQEEARRLLATALAEAGFADAGVSVTSRCQQARCSPLFSVSPGEPVRVGRVVLAGLAKTRPQVVEAVHGLRPGEPFSPDALLAAQRRLLALGIFERIGIQPIPGQESGAQRGLVIEAREAPSRTLSGGIGWDTEEKLRISGSWADINLFGKARILSFEGRFSSRQRRLQINYREPGKLGLFGLPTWVAVYRTEESFPTYSLLRRGMWVELGDHLQRPRRFLLRYDYQIIAPDAPAEILSSLERNRQHLRLASLTPILEWDTRNDLFSPSEGFFASLQVQRAFPVFLADASFSKFSGTFSLYSPLGPTVLALGLRGGLIQPLGEDRHLPDNLRVPIAVRFFAGGRVSHRAFPTDRLGVPGQTLLCPAGKPQCTMAERQPVGGAALALASLEWRVPVAGSFGATLFLDGGNTWAGFSQVQPEDVRWGAGLGLRFETPVGPLRLEYGWKLDRLPGESKGELFLAFGNPF